MDCRRAQRDPYGPIMPGAYSSRRLAGTRRRRATCGSVMQSFTTTRTSALMFSLPPILHVLVAGLIAYTAIVLFVRISGKRSLSKMNAFDLIVTIALGSTLSTALLPSTPTLASGVAGFAILLVLQFLLTWGGSRSRRLNGWIKSSPRLLVRHGVMLDDAMKDERITHDEVRAAARSQGIADFSQVGAIVLETDGTLSVVRSSSENWSSLVGVTGWNE